MSLQRETILGNQFERIWLGEYTRTKGKKYFIVAANAKNEMCVVDTIGQKVLKPCINVGKVPHPTGKFNVYNTRNDIY